ncbi:hypothetical protein BDR26DRAFT_864301 [Obelidium mucronatum]|nr:hypothetical protein BDR26DRAFT_864301 [Obelidium mucronatum]
MLLSLWRLVKSTFKTRLDHNSSSRSSSSSSSSKRMDPLILRDQTQPDWCNDDVSTHELNTDDDDMWYMNYLFGAPPSPTKMAAAPKSRPPLPAKAKTQQLQQQQKGGNNKRNRVKKPLSAQERAEINYFVAHLFDGPSPKSRSASNYNKAALAPTKKRNRVKKPLSAQEKAEINYFVAHLFDGPSSVKAKPIQKTNSPATAPAQNRRRGNKKPLTHQERLEISNFVTHLFDGTPQIKITRKQQKLTTQERNEICYFVNHLFDYGKTKKPMVIRKKAQQKKKFVLLYNVEKENARKAVFDIWAAANPGWGTSRHQNGPYPKSERSQRMRRNRQAKKAARQRKALRRHRNL